MSQPPDDPYRTPQPGDEPDRPEQPGQGYGQGYPQGYGQGSSSYSPPGQPYGQPGQPYGQPGQPYGYGAGGPYDGASVEQLRAEKPDSVVRLVQVMVLGAILSVLSGAYALLTIDDALAEVAVDLDGTAAEAGVDPAALADIAGAAGAVSIVLVTAVAAGLWLLFAALFSRGQGRVAGTVLGAINALGTLFGLFGLLAGAGPVEALLTLLDAAVITAGLVLLWVPASSAWFRAMSAARQRSSWG